MQLGRHVIIAVVAIVALTSRALAAPAVIKVFEAKAHSAPADVAPVLATFPENAQVSVSEEVTDGWRRVRLSDGRVAFIHDGEVTMVDTPAPKPAPVAVAPTPAVVTPIGPPPQPAAHIYVKDLNHLAELVKSDSVVYPKAKDLADRRMMTLGLAIVSGAVGIGLMLLSVTALTTESCDTVFNPPICSHRPNVSVLVIGGAIGTIGPLIGLALSPSRNDLLDVLNEWNTRHVDQPFTLDRQPALGR